MLNKIWTNIKNFFSLSSDQNMDEAYLAGAVDIYDLENRMRKLERGSHLRNGLHF